MKKNKLLGNYIAELRDRFGKNLKNVILFGSRARAENTKESDYDLLLIFKKVVGLEKNFVDEIADRYLLEYGTVFSTFIFSQEEIEAFSYEPFIMNARKEGINL